MKCSVCDNTFGEENFCEIHKAAYKNVMEAFKSWQRAMDVEWKDYLKRIIDNDYTGKRAREVAEFLLSKES